MRIRREQLYEEVWAEPMTKVAARYGTYSNILTRVCQRLNVPRPPQGHWARKAVGRGSRKPPLPGALPGDEIEWVRGEWAPSALPLPERPTTRPRQRARASEHALIVEARRAFGEANTTEVGYLAPSITSLVDLFVSKATLERATAAFNTLLLLLERRGHRVVLAPRDVSYTHHVLDHREKKGRELRPSEVWSAGRPTLVFVRGVAFGLRLFEVAEEIEVRYVNGKYVPVEDLPEPKRRRWAPSYEWTTHRDRPSGRLSLHAYSPYHYAKWSQQWTEKSAGTLPRSFRNVVRTLEGEEAKLRALVAEGRRKEEEEQRRWEEQRLRWEREAEEKERAQALKESREQFLAIVESWAFARNLETFFGDIQDRISSLPPETQDLLQQRLSRAREIFGGTDALLRFEQWLPPEDR